jgi:hypothetical protein
VITEILNRAAADGLILFPEGPDSLRVRGPAAARTKWVDTLRQHKAAILRHLWTENLHEHFQEVLQILEREIRLPRSEAESQARAAAALLAFKLKAPWCALREALGDQSLPNSDDPVDRIPYPLPHWLRLPNDSQSDKASNA